MNAAIYECMILPTFKPRPNALDFSLDLELNIPWMYYLVNNSFMKCSVYYLMNSNCACVRSTTLDNFALDQTSLDKKTELSTSLNKVAKRSRHFTQHACRALYSEKSRAFGQGFAYCGVLLLHNTRTQSGKLDSFHNRKREAKIALQSVTNASKQRACTIVRACLDNDVIEPFKNYFQLIEHSIQTRHNSNLIPLPKIETEYARRSFSFTAAKEFNMLPSEAREMPGPKLKSFLKRHFS